MLQLKTLSSINISCYSPACTIPNNSSLIKQKIQWMNLAAQLAIHTQKSLKVGKCRKTLSYNTIMLNTYTICSHLVTS